MWTTADELRLTIVKGLRRGLKLCRGMRRSLTEDEQKKVARVIVEEIASQKLARRAGAAISLTMTHTQTDADDVFDYQQRVVAFVNVLGFSQLVKANDTDLAARDKLRRMIETSVVILTLVSHGRLYRRFQRRSWSRRRAWDDRCVYRDSR
jgi:hypothetical protein